MSAVLGVRNAYRQLAQELTLNGSVSGLGCQSKVLDAGIGAGDLTLALAQQLKELPEIHGIDLSPRMLTVARRRLSTLGQRGLSGRLRLGSIVALPYADHSFDAILCAHVIEHCDSPKLGVQELMRVLKPSGTLILVTSRQHAVNAIQGARWGFQPLQPHRLHEMLLHAGAQTVSAHRLGKKLWLPTWISYALVARRESG